MRLILCIFLSLSLWPALADDPAPRVDIIEMDGVINPSASEFFRRVLRSSEEEGAACLIVQLDTPGGLVETMRDITKDMMAARIPVVVYVSPSGARAASAGCFITLAAHIAAMAPGTNIGAASVVTMGAPADSNNATLMRKATNDAVAFIKSIAEERGRNVEWAEKAVRDAAAVPANEALKVGIIDFISPSLDSLMLQIDGRTVKTTAGEVLLKTVGARRHFIEKPLRYKILDVISDPNIAYILFILGLYGLIFELYSPGAIFPGVLGGICIILAFYAMNTLPVNYAGVLLIVLAVILFLLEIKVPSYGALTIGGVVSFVLGSLMLYDSQLAFMQISWEIIAGVTIVTVLFFGLAVGLGIRAQRKKPVIGREFIMQALGRALDDFHDGVGQIHYEGEIWRAVSSEPISKGELVKVVRIEGLTLTVTKADSTPKST